MEEIQAHQISLLFVEDNETIRALYQRRLSKRVQQFFVAENGQEGMEIYREHKPDLVITDISMPIMNGLEMIRNIKEFDPEVNVIVMSAYSIKEYFLEAINLGVNGYLVKPVDPKKLYALIDELAGNILMEKALEEKELKRSIAESNLKKSLAEKDILLKEVHHRVKNNMQIISSILKMQERLVDDPRLKTVLGESQNRIRSMALIHENLYRNETLANIKFGNYVQSLTNNLSRTYSDLQGKVTFDYDIEDVFLPIDVGIPCGLIINELISNSFKHAFKGRENGKIFVGLSIVNGNEFTLSVADDGVGMDGTRTIETSGSLGMRIVSKLVQQIDGNLEYDFSGGTKYTIKFKNQ
jgi:two-component sensor histidine kinase